MRGKRPRLTNPACDHQPGRPWRKITRRLVSGPSDKGNPAGPGGAVFSGRCRMDGESPEDGPLCRGNKTLSALNIRESDFWQPGTRAVMFSQPASQLLAGARMDVYVIRDGEGN